MVKIILFVCTENSCRSQMAEGFFNHYNKNPLYKGASAGIISSGKVNPLAINVMGELGIDISNQKSKTLTAAMVGNADKIFTMGCIKSCPLTPPEKTQDWDLEDPANKPIDKFREVRDSIRLKIKKLIFELE